MKSLIFLSVIVASLSVVSADAPFADIANKGLDIASHFIDKLKFLVKLTNEPSNEEAKSSEQVAASPAKRAKVLAQATAPEAENVKTQPEAPAAVVTAEKSAVVPQAPVIPTAAQPTVAVKIAQQAQPVTAATVTTAKAAQASQAINVVPPSQEQIKTGKK
ncbi:venom protein J isoform X1 [Nasonia vitripennis]|uniref:Uncharacterized protein n=1 Tax=Nasonia vitripennis TaxID=7425 RepID=A0A7M7HHB0_NASVI|nr:venom protein J isoform X1 [Nasonia vitripennis]